LAWLVLPFYENYTNVFACVTAFLRSANRYSALTVTAAISASAISALMIVLL
jgi:hypothetical protein